MGAHLGDSAAVADDDGGEERASLQIDPSFVVPPEHRPARAVCAAASLSAPHIPLIDLAPLHHRSTIDTAALKDLVSQIGLACEQWGFFQVINHGVPHAIIQNMKDEAKFFFELPAQKKLQVKKTYANPLGYNDGELTKNVRDWKEVFDMALGGSWELPAHADGDDHDILVHLNQWPSFMPSLRKACEEYVSTVQPLAFSLLELIAQSLGLPPHRLHEEFKSSATSRFRLNHYPVCPKPELALGLGWHKDSGGLTVLLQDEVAGLEVKTKDGEWISVKPNPQAFIINVGAVIQVFSNDKYESVEHRVVANENTDRYSFPLFLNPAHWVELSPLSELIDDKHPPRYRPFNWGKFYRRRNDTNFKNLGVENLQMSDYRIVSSNKEM